MKRTILAVVVWLAAASPARAQFVVGPVYGSGVTYGSGLGFSYHKHKLRVVGFAGGYYSRSAFAPVGPFGFGPAWSVGPGFGPDFGPGFGWNSGWAPGWGVYAPPPPVIVLPPPIIFAGNNGNGNGNAMAAGGIPARPADEPRPLPAGGGDFLVIAPKKPDFPPPGKIVPEVDRVAAGMRPPLLPPPPKFDPFAVPPPIKIDRPDPDPVKEAARQLKLGRESFALGEYGKAGEHFDRAAVANPKAAEPHFLKAQAAFAAGSYADAVAAIRAGLVIDPAWPAGTFDPKEPYGANPAAFAAHLAELRKVTAANPGESTLEFLLGYQLWFVGEKVEARKWFDAAEKRIPGLVALFK
jgi:hypothetical protein